MKEWENMFEVKQTSDPQGLRWVRYAVFKKGDTEPYGRLYSSRIDAKRGAAHIYRHYVKSFEKNVLGQ